MVEVGALFVESLPKTCVLKLGAGRGVDAGVGIGVAEGVAEGALRVLDVVFGFAPDVTPEATPEVTPEAAPAPFGSGIYCAARRVRSLALFIKRLLMFVP